MQPHFRPEPLVLEPVNPHLAPPIADNLWIRWTAVIHLHDAAPPEIIIQQAAPRKMDAFVKTVIRTHNRNDCFELRWPPRRYLKRIVGSPGLTHHADMPRAPRLSGNP